MPRLLETLKHLRDLGNTVIVVEHDEDAILHRRLCRRHRARPPASMAARSSPQGTPARDHGQSELDHRQISVRRAARSRCRRARRELKKNRRIKVVGARGNNLKNVTAEIPLGTFTCVTGVSGGGKSTFLIETLYKAASRRIMGSREHPAEHDRIEGLEFLDKVIDIDQSPIGRTPRSNPATYTGAFTPIRDWFAGLPEAKARGYQPGPLLLQRQGRPLRGLPGRRRHQDRDALPARRLRHLRRLPRQALQPRDAGGAVQGQVDRRRAGHDGRGRRRVLRGRARRARQAGDAEAGRPRLHPGRPAGDHAVGRRGAAHQACQGTVAQGDRQDALHPRRADHRPAFPRRRASCSKCCTNWSTRATRSSSSSTISKSSRPPTGCSTSAPKAATAAARWWRRARRKTSSREQRSYTGQFLKELLERRPRRKARSGGVKG